jgi:hypothetical protein
MHRSCLKCETIANNECCVRLCSTMSIAVDLFLMPDHRFTAEEIDEMDAKDRDTHPMTTTDGTVAYHFTLGGCRAQDRALALLLETHVRKAKRIQVPLCCCPICKSGLGQYIFSRQGNEGFVRQSTT